MTISQQAGDVRGRALQGAIGQCVYSSHLTRLTTALNEDPQAVQIDDITPVAANDATYTVTVNGVSASFTADSSATVAEITAGLTAAINAEPLIRGVLAPTDATTKVTLTGLTPGLAYTLATSTSGGGSLASASVQAAADADAVPFGRLVVDAGLSPYGNDQLGKLAKSTGFTAQTVVQTITYVLNATYLVTIRDEAGAVIAQGETAADTDTATTTAAIAATMNGLLPADSVLASDNATDVTFTAELAGREFSVEVGTNEAGQVGGAIGAQTSDASTATSVNRAAIGLTMFSSNDPTPTIGGTAGEYGPNAGMRVLQGANSMWVERDAAVSEGDPVYVELDGTGDDAGKLFTTDSATRVLLTGASWERDGVNTADGIAAVRADF